ncbi:hypothetical protein OF83DRAFT_622834 [Amylostereum chailletii]|nr:hypothetical protein OF83DRAFT_622834 [Amylostereum chailletii]
MLFSDFLFPCSRAATLASKRRELGVAEQALPQDVPSGHAQPGNGARRTTTISKSASIPTATMLSYDQCLACILRILRRAPHPGLRHPDVVLGLSDSLCRRGGLLHTTVFRPGSMELTQRQPVRPPARRSCIRRFITVLAFNRCDSEIACKAAVPLSRPPERLELAMTYLAGCLRGLPPEITPLEWPTSLQAPLGLRRRAMLRVRVPMFVSLDVKGRRRGL